MALSVLRSISNDVAGKYYSIMIDEMTDNSNVLRAVQDVMLHMNLNIINCRGQCYDGAGNIAVIRSGFTTKIINLESRALYTHFYGHACPKLGCCSKALK